MKKISDVFVAILEHGSLSNEFEEVSHSVLVSLVVLVWVLVSFPDQYLAKDLQCLN